MEAGALGRPSPLRPAPPKQSLGSDFLRGLADPARNVVEEAGKMASFSGRAFLELRGVPRYSGEVIRQAGILIAGSALIIWFMNFIIGTMCGTEAVYTLRGYGATAYAGAFTTLCGTREMGLYMFAYMLSAKVGCGLVAEIGSMRIGEEIDAMESIGLSSMRYIVGTRLVAAFLTLPLLFIVGLAFTNLGHYVVVVVQLGDISQGGWESVHWALQNPRDILYVVIKTMFMSTVILLVAMYYGYNASGGPVGVGSATARSMIFNLVVVNVTSTLMTLLFWGLDAKLPIGG